ncbi:MAG TPA: radical SAM protein [Candidatus Sumerlaeota bacterium]|nr:radical SAM protein [Candidatus Sumerlaeota bacterium]
MSVDLNKNRWGRHFSPEEIADARDNNRLLTMEIETSHVCNLRCVYCYSGAGHKQTNELSLEEILNAIRQGMYLGVRRVIIIGGGEPMLYPHLFDIIEFLHERDIAIDLFTNGTILNSENARMLYDYGVEPVVKCNSLNPSVQDFLSDVPGSFAQIQRGIERLRAAGYPDADHDMGIETIICAQNIPELPTLWRWARDRGLIPYFEMITFQGKAKRRYDLNVPVPELRRLFEDLARIDREEYGHTWEPHPPVAGLSCARHEYSCTITSTGYVYPCVGVDVKVGNVRYDTLANILRESPVVQSLRQIRNHVKGACHACEQVEGCYGCRGMAYHLMGDFLAPDPLCWHNPKHLGSHLTEAKGPTV